ncbi:HAMP domain-containing histidine kinase [Carnobacteriaceae bacterium zg-C25]|nr:HAMP domain-containing histidine kinase [Carnobacteriaceae bacterium zg-C25]
MFRRLRVQFITIAMIAVVFVVVSFATLINAVSFIQTNSQMETVLNALSQNDGVLPEYRNLPQIPQVDMDDMIYFSRVISSTGELMKHNTQQVALTVSEQEILVKKIDVNTAKIGYLFHENKTYGYQVSDRQPHKLLVVVDVTRYIQQRETLMNVTLQITFVSIMVFFVMVYVFSKKAIQPFVENYDKQKRFIANVGHELKTPLSIILANTEMQEMLSGESEWLQSTKDQSQRLTTLINNMVSLASLEEQPDIVLSDVDLSAVVQDAAEDFKGPIIRQGKTFELSIVPNLIVKAEEKSLFELVTILVDNANKYCDEQGHVRVSVRPLKNLRHKVRLDVTNTYAEGETVDYTRFFDRFYREDESRNSKGFGIGLSMAQSFVKIFKGKIFVTYKEGAITFTVLL